MRSIVLTRRLPICFWVQGVALRSYALVRGGVSPALVFTLERSGFFGKGVWGKTFVCYVLNTFKFKLLYLQLYF